MLTDSFVVIIESIQNIGGAFRCLWRSVRIWITTSGILSEVITFVLTALWFINWTSAFTHVLLQWLLQQKYGRLLEIVRINLNVFQIILSDSRKTRGVTREGLENDSRTTREWFENDSRVCSRMSREWLENDSRMTRERLENDSRTIRERLENGSRVI